MFAIQNALGVEQRVVGKGQLGEIGKLADRIKRNETEPNQQIKEAWQRTLGRNPAPEDVARATEVLRDSDLQTLCWVLFNASEFLQVRPGSRFFGVGGRGMRAAGVETFFAIDKMGAVGVVLGATAIR